jgi:hypothetical protein
MKISKMRLMQIIKEEIKKINERVHNELDYGEFMSILDELQYDFKKSNENDLYKLTISIQQYFAKNKKNNIQRNDVLKLLKSPKLSEYAQNSNIPLNHIVDLYFSM